MHRSNQGELWKARLKIEWQSPLDYYINQVKLYNMKKIKWHKLFIVALLIWVANSITAISLK